MGVTVRPLGPWVSSSGPPEYLIGGWQPSQYSLARAVPASAAPTSATAATTTRRRVPATDRPYIAFTALANRSQRANCERPAGAPVTPELGLVHQVPQAPSSRPAR